MTDPTLQSSTPYHGGRLQRPAKKQEAAVLRFTQVIIRHLGTMAAIAVVTGALVSSAVLFGNWLSLLQEHTLDYALGILIVLLAIVIYSRLKNIPLSRLQFAWISYLALISVIEEIAFRVFIPLALNSYLSFQLSIILSSLIFGFLHYVTLRWRLSACLITVLGGIGFSRLLQETDDLALVVLVHWVITFLNTPRPPVGLPNIDRPKQRQTPS